METSCVPSLQQWQQQPLSLYSEKRGKNRICYSLWAFWCGISLLEQWRRLEASGISGAQLCLSRWARISQLSLWQLLLPAIPWTLSSLPAFNWIFLCVYIQFLWLILLFTITLFFFFLSCRRWHSKVPFIMRNICRTLSLLALPGLVEIIIFNQRQTHWLRMPQHSSAYGEC